MDAAARRPGAVRMESAVRRRQHTRREIGDATARADRAVGVEGAVQENGVGIVVKACPQIGCVGSNRDSIEGHATEGCIVDTPALAGTATLASGNIAIDFAAIGYSQRAEDDIADTATIPRGVVRLIAIHCGVVHQQSR